MGRLRSLLDVYPDLLIHAGVEEGTGGGSGVLHGTGIGLRCEGNHMGSSVVGETIYLVVIAAKAEVRVPRVFCTSFKV